MYKIIDIRTNEVVHICHSLAQARVIVANIPWLALSGITTIRDSELSTVISE